MELAAYAHSLRTSSPHRPSWAVGWLGARLRTPARRLRRVEARRGLRRLPPSAPQGRGSSRVPFRPARLMLEVQPTLEAKNRDKFTQNLTLFRHDIKNLF